MNDPHVEHVEAMNLWPSKHPFLLYYSAAPLGKAFKAFSFLQIWYRPINAGGPCHTDHWYPVSRSTRWLLSQRRRGDPQRGPYCAPIHRARDTYECMNATRSHGAFTYLLSQLQSTLQINSYLLIFSAKGIYIKAAITWYFRLEVTGRYSCTSELKMYTWCVCYLISLIKKHSLKEVQSIWERQPRLHKGNKCLWWNVFSFYFATA